MIIINKLKGDFNFHLPFNKLLAIKDRVVKLSAILLLTFLFSIQSIAEEFDAKAFFESSIENTKAKAHEFVDLYLIQTISWPPILAG